MYEFEVVSKIVGKGRPRLNTYTGTVYTPTKTKDYEEFVRQCFLIKNAGAKMLDKRVNIEIKAYFKIPLSSSNKQKNDMILGNISPIKKPDIDNIVKIILDSLNGFVIVDDTQVTKLSVEKLYGTEEKVYVKIEEY